MGPTFERTSGGELLKARLAASALLVVFKGLRNDRSQSLRKLALQLHELYPNVDILLLPCIGGSIWGFSSVEDQVTENLKTLDKVCERGGYTDIRFTSYSMGAAIARKVLVEAFESNTNPPDSRTWHRRVTRLVSIVGYARGWIANPRMAVGTRILLNGFGFFGHLLKLLQAFRKVPVVPVIFALRRGSPFIFNTRMQWLRLARSAEWRSQNVVVVHVMSSNEELVSAVEVIDVESDDQYKGVHYMTVPKSNHSSVVDVSVGRGQNGSLERLDYLLAAIAGGANKTSPQGAFGSLPVLDLDDPQIALPVDYLDDTVASKPNSDVGRFVFVVHGIRDTGAWAKKIGAELRRQFDAAKRATGNTKELRTDTQSYGYFTAFPFVFPWIRSQKVEWLMDRYATARALYPDAIFSFVGHSNGTYLAAAALRDYEMCEFERIAFAGSVVRADFDWNQLNEKRQRIEKVANYVATSDMVVAVGPNGIKRLFGRFFDLGSAGHDGFDCGGLVHNVCFAVGGHGAGIAEHTWAATARFILDGDIPVPLPTDRINYAVAQSSLTKQLGRLSPLLLLILSTLVLSLGWGFSENLVGLPQWSPIQFLFSLPAAILPADLACPTFAATSNAIRCFWAAYATLPKLAQSLCMGTYWWLVWLALFRL